MEYDERTLLLLMQSVLRTLQSALVELDSSCQLVNSYIDQANRDIEQVVREWDSVHCQRQKQTDVLAVRAQQASQTRLVFLAASEAIRRHDTSAACNLINQESQVALYFDDRSQCSLLHISAEMLDAKVTELLLDKGAQINWRNGDGRTPLALALDKVLASHDNFGIAVGDNPRDESGTLQLLKAHGAKVTR